MYKIPFLTVLFLISGCKLVQPSPKCWDFKTSSSAGEWTNSGQRPWLWSGSAGAPPSTYFPSFFTPPDGAGYMYLYDLTAAPNSGTLRTTSANIQIEANDIVTINIWRHVIYDDGTYRPVLTFVSDSGTNKRSLLWSYDYDTWDSVSIICGPGDEPCCRTFPCQGYIALEGSILTSGELLAVTEIGIANSCGA